MWLYENSNKSRLYTLKGVYRKHSKWQLQDRIHFCNKRNVVERVKVGEDIIVIKRYKRPTIANCIVYTFFRKNKARRSFEYAKRLLKIGIDTAKPIAYIELNSYGFFHTGYYISEWLLYTPLQKIFAETKEKEKIKMNS